MIIPLTLEHALQVTSAMRAADCREAYSVRWNDDPTALAQDFASSDGPKYAVLADDGSAVAMFGAVVLTPVVAEMWMVGTDRMGEKESEIIKAGHAACMSLLNDAGFARLQAHTACYRSDTQNLLKLLGFSYDGEMQGYGNDGSAFHLYSMTRRGARHAGGAENPARLAH